MFANLKPRRAIEAKVVDGALVVSFAGDNPRVWRTGLSNLSSASVQLQESQGKYRVLMQSPGHEEEIGVFATKAEAAQVLSIIGDAMMTGGASGAAYAHGPVYGQAAAPHRSFLARLMKGLLWIAGILAALFLLLMLLLPGSRHVAAPAASDVRTGVPVPAEELFGR